MSHSFGSVYYLDIGIDSSTTPSFGPTETFILTTPVTNIFGPTETFNVAALALQINGTPTYLSTPAVNLQSAGSPVEFSTQNFAAGLFIVGNLIQSSNTSSINVTNITIADKSGSGNCTWSPYTGSSIQFNGLGLNTENQTANYTIALEKSGRVWTNTGAGSITGVLPSGAPQGWFAMFQRTGGVLTIQPGANDKFIYGTDAIVKSDGAVGTIASSGGYMCLMSDVNANWTRFLFGGTIT